MVLLALTEFHLCHHPCPESRMSFTGKTAPTEKSPKHRQHPELKTAIKFLLILEMNYK